MDGKEEGLQCATTSPPCMTGQDYNHSRHLFLHPSISPLLLHPSFSLSVHLVCLTKSSGWKTLTLCKAMLSKQLILMVTKDERKKKLSNQLFYFYVLFDMKMSMCDASFANKQ